MIDLVKKLLYFWVDKIVEDLEKLTTDKQKEEEQKVIEETKEELEPVKIEVLRPMEIKEAKSGEITIKKRKPKSSIVYNREKYLKKMKKETPEQREKRLQYMRDYHAKQKQKIADLKQEAEMREIERKFNDAGNFSL